jgi:putative transposase
MARNAPLKRCGESLVLGVIFQRSPCVRTLRLKVKREGYAWLKTAATEVNQVWNWANETSFGAISRCAGHATRLSAYDLNKLATGGTKFFEHIGSETIQRVTAEFVTRRNQGRKFKLKWRKSYGSRRSLGWIPFKAAQLKRKGRVLRFAGKAFRVFERDLLDGCRWRSGCFAQDAVGDWWLCLPVLQSVSQTTAPHGDVGIDLGLKDTATTSDGDRLEAGQFYRGIERKIAMAQRRGHKRQVKRLHRKAARRRKDALHKFSRRIVDQYQHIFVGDVSSLKLAKTRMAKSVLDAGWGMLKRQLRYKGEYAGRCVRIVNERNTTRACSSCRALTGPAGLDSLVVRSWMCSGCGDTHDRDVNAAKNILFTGRCSPSVSGNESAPSEASPGSTSRRRKARIRALTVAT